MFLESLESQKYIDSIAIIKSELFSKTLKTSVKCELPSYDLNKGGFKITVEESYVSPNSREEEYNYYKSALHRLNGFWFPSVNFTTYLGIANAVKQLFINCDEKTASILEKQTVELIFFFRITGDIIKKKEYYIFNYKDFPYPITQDVALIINFKGNDVLTVEYY